VLLVFGSYNPYLTDTVATRRSAVVVAITLAKSIRRKAHGLVAMYGRRKFQVWWSWVKEDGAGGEGPATEIFRLVSAAELSGVAVATLKIFDTSGQYTRTRKLVKRFKVSARLSGHQKFSTANLDA